MTANAWYLGLSKSEIAERVVLVGDPGRVPRVAALLDDSKLYPTNRGLATASGYYRGTRILVAAFGMGAPIAAIVMHELAALGANRFLRIGTSMNLPPVPLGDLMIAESAVVQEGTSHAYAEQCEVSFADKRFVETIATHAREHVPNVRVGRFASFDGFYRDMFALEPSQETRIKANFSRLASEGVIGVDMETSALLTVGATLGVAVSSLCVATVDSRSREKLDAARMANAEILLAKIAYAALQAA